MRHQHTITLQYCNIEGVHGWQVYRLTVIKGQSLLLEVWEWYHWCLAEQSLHKTQNSNVVLDLLKGFHPYWLAITKDGRNLIQTSTKSSQCLWFSPPVRNYVVFFLLLFVCFNNGKVAQHDLDNCKGAKLKEKERSFACK